MYEGIFWGVESDSKQACGKVCPDWWPALFGGRAAGGGGKPRRIPESARERLVNGSVRHGNQLSVIPMEKDPGSALCQEKGSFTRGQERWKKVTAQGRKGKLSSPSKMLLQSRCEALGTLDKAHQIEEEPMQEILPRSESPTPCNKTCEKQLPEETTASYSHWCFSPVWYRSTHLQTGRSFQGGLLPLWGTN